MDVTSPLLLLTHSYNPDNQCLWRAALLRGWRTERIGTSSIDIQRKIQGCRPIRYYGDMLHQGEAAKNLPIRFSLLDINNLPDLPIELTGRKIELGRARDYFPVREEAFYKATGIKWIESRKYVLGETPHAKPDDFIYKQSLVDFSEEIRCFVLDGEIVTASWYRTQKVFTPKPLEDENLLRILKDLTNQVYKAAKWPRGIVFDFGRLSNGDWVFIEANEAWASGTYHCDCERVLDTIIVSQESGGEQGIL